MQIEIPDLDDDLPPPTSFTAGQPTSAFSPSPSSHRRDGSNTSNHQNQPNSAFSFPIFTSPIQSSSRPFGGQHPHLITNFNLACNPSPSPVEHGHSSEMRRKTSLTAQHIHVSSSGTNLNGSIHQNLISRPAPPRKLSVASIRGTSGSKSATPTESARLHRNNGSDLLNSSAGLNPVLASPFLPCLSPGPSGPANGRRSPRSRSNTTTTSTTNSGASGSSDPHAPLEVAIYLIMDRFFEECETKMSQLMGKAIPIANEEDVYIPYWLGQGADPSFDGTFDSLAQVSKKNPSQVINFVMRWKSRQGEDIDEHAIQRALISSGNTASARRVATVLAERKGLALVFLLCRALIAIAQGVTKETLGEELGCRLEEIVFNSIKNADPSATSRVPNKQANMNMFAHLLGVLSNIRFAGVSDRFVAEIDLMNRSALIKEQKDNEGRLVYLIRGIRYLKLKVYPLEAFEETADFIAAFASIFDASRGSLVKTAMAETLSPLLAQIVQSASAEVNHPVWNKAIIMIFNKAHSMSDKPSKARYWNATVPLLCSVVGAAPQDFLLAKWSSSVDWCFAKMKEKVTRPTMMLGIVQLVWSYLHRVREGASALNKRLEPILKSAFPPDRKTVYPAEVSLDTFASLVHYILHWQLDYGSEFTLRTLLTGSPDASESGAGLVAHAGADRIIIGISSSLRALTSLETGEDPTYPITEPQNVVKAAASSIHHATEFESSNREVETSHGKALKSETLDRPRIKAFVDAIGTKVLQIAAYCDRALATYTLTDDRHIAPWHDSIAQRAEILDSPLLVKRHGAFAVEYPRHVQPIFEVLQACLQAWPRILTSSAAESAALDILFRGLISLDVNVTVESKHCLRRFIASGKSYLVLQSYTRFLAKSEFFFRSKPQLQKGSDQKVEALVKLWVEVLSAWCDQLRKIADGIEQALHSPPSCGPEGLKLVSQMEATSLVLLCSRSSSTRKSAIDALRITGTARTIIQQSGQPMTPTSINFSRNTSIADLLDEAEIDLFDTIIPEDLPSTEKTRLLKWKKQRKPGSHESLTRLLESDHAADVALLCIALSSIFSTALKYLPSTMVHARSLLYSQLQKIYPLASEAAGVGARSTVNGNGPNPGWDDRNLLISWSSLLISLTSITTSSDPKVGNLSTGIDNSSIANHSNSTRERSISPGEDLIKTLVPFLTSDQSPFREATIRAMSCIHVSMYQTLLDGLSGLAHHLTSERKMIEAQKDRSARPNGTVKIIRLFSAIGKLHESTTKFLFYPDFQSTDRCVEILLRFIRETCLFLRSRQTMEDHLTVSIRKSFLVFGERVLRKQGIYCDTHTGFDINQYFSNDLVLDMFNLAEDWSTRLPTGPNGGLDARNSRTNSISSRANTPLKVGSTSNLALAGGAELLIQSATMIATLCETALDIRSSSSSHRRKESGRERPTVSAGRILRWVANLFEKGDPNVLAEARRAFVGACRRTSDPEGLLECALMLCWSESDGLPLHQTIFGVLGSTLIAEPTLQLRADALLALCLSRIPHPDLTIRQRALDVLKAHSLVGVTARWLTQIDIDIQSTFTGHHLVAQKSLSTSICDMKTIDPTQFIIELGSRIIQGETHKARSLARLMPIWLSQITIAPAVCDIGSPKVKNLLSVVLLVSASFVDTQPDEVGSMWLASATASPLNTAAIITYLLDQTTRRALPPFVRLARIILSAMTENSGLEVVAQHLISSLHPAKLLASNDIPSLVDPGLGSSRTIELDSHFPQLPARTVLSYMQASILLLGEAMVLKPTGLGDQLSSVVHAYVVQADHTNVTLRSQMRDSLVRYVCMLRRMQPHPSNGSLSHLSSPSATDSLDSEVWRTFWDFEDSGASRRHRKILPTNLEYLVEEISHLTSGFMPDFCKQWAKVAIEWATQCPVRHVACRSLQVLRVLALPVDSNLLAELLVRLSNTASDPSADIQLFALEVLITLSACVKVQNVNHTPFAQLFWTGVSCLETANDLEFLEAIDLMKSILEPLDEANCFEIEASRPSCWTADGGPIRQLVTKGLRSSQLCQPSWSLIRQLLYLPDGCRIVDWANGGWALLYAACLPWCLHILETGVMQYEMDDIALRLAHLTGAMGMDGISRVMVSFAKRRFRTNEDFLRQAVNGIREYFLPLFAPDILVLYFGFLLNPLDWLRVKTLAVLKLYVKMIDPNAPEIMDLGYDLLTPILNLLQTNVSQQALDILSEPLPVKGKPYFRGRKASPESPAIKKVFGNPDETGWCVSDLRESLQRTRKCLVDVIDTFAHSFISETLKRPSVVEFTYDWGPEADNNADAQTQSDFAETNESFGEMVSTLHDLSDFFGQDGTSPGSRISSPLNPSTARVAAILSRSLSKRRANRPSLQVRKSNNSQPAPSGAGPTLPSVGSSRPHSIVNTSSSSSSLSHQAGQHRTSFSVDSRDDDIYEEDEEYEEYEEGGRGSPTGTYCTDDSQSVFAFELDDDHHRNSLMRRKSRPPEG